MNKAIKESIHDAITTTSMMLGLVILLAAIVTLCSCSSYKQSVHTQTSEQTDTAFQRTRQLDLSISRLVTSRDSGWSRIVIFDTSLPVLELTGLPPVKAIIETGNVRQEETEETTSVQDNDSTSVEIHTESQKEEDKDTEVEVGDTKPINWLLWGLLLGGCAVIAIILKIKL